MAKAAFDAAAFIRDHVCDPIKLEDVADAVGYSRSIWRSCSRWPTS